jgi:gliding motility-associated-like protein
MTGFTKGKSQIRVITTSLGFGCKDTSEYVPITIKGSAAGFEALTDNICFKSSLFLKDTSNAYNSTIQSWQWNFGDGQIQTLTEGGSTISHNYANPGSYNVTLKVTDASGCSSTTSTSAHSISVNGPKASFASSGTSVSLNTTVQFYNNTNNYNSNTTQYGWDFGDGSTSNEYGPTHLYNTTGDYTVRLIAKNEVTGCADTVFQKIFVNSFNVNFSFTKSFLSSSKCPPVLVQFSNSSSNYSSVNWDFGDGTKAQNNDRPTHVYTQPGKYMVRLTITNENGLSSTHTESIVIEQPVVNVTADILRSCTAQSVTISAISENASSYLWDFGDGTIAQAADTFSTHYYSRAGNYTPQLIAKDANGCPVSVKLSDKIIIDSLSLSLSDLPQEICTPKEVVFNPVITSIAADQAQQALIYHWDFGTGLAKDTADKKIASFTYQQPGTYTVSLKVESLSGCIKETKTTITAYQGLGGQINGPPEICEGSSAQFTGTTLLPGQPQWKWIFDDGSTVNKQNPPAKIYNNAGTFPIKLVVDNSGCADTIASSLVVHAKPTVSLSSKQAVVCEGSGVSITAGGGTSYAWSPSTGLNDINNATIIASPVTNTTYIVSVTNANRCINTDSVKITVVHPFQLSVQTEATVCKGNSIELKPSGAAFYQWIGNTDGLTNTSIPNPLATPPETLIYTVVGSDKDKCFTDTASIQVLVNPAPTVDAGQSVEILMGSPYQLQPVASSDVQKWNWSPSKYLSCISCQTPETRPIEPMNYKLTVTNNFGCTASDTVSIKLFCSESRIYIPNSFSPNNDGVNDRFSIKGQGIRIVKSLRIYSRWGEVLFERSNFQVDDQSAAWDGRFKGVLVPIGSYIYFTEMSCNEQTFTQKGTVTVVH